MEESDKVGIERIIDDLEQHSASGTELVTIYVPGGYNLVDLRSHLESEIAEAQNIKSKNTRKKVESALRGILNKTKTLDNVPENGLAFFSGDVDGSNETIVIEDIPTPIDSFIYKCDSNFVLDPLKKSISPDGSFGLIIITRNKYIIGKLVGENIITIKEEDSLVPGKTSKGGQSQARFERLREEKLHEFFKSAAEDLEQSLLGDVDGFLVGGSDITMKSFIDGDYLHHEIRDNIICNASVSNAETSGLENLVSKCQDSLEETRIKEEKEILEKFYKRLGEGGKKVTYGLDKVEEALNYDSVETLILSEKLEYERIEELMTECERQGGQSIVISQKHEDGERFYQTFEVGALLRFRLE